MARRPRRRLAALLTAAALAACSPAGGATTGTTVTVTTGAVGSATSTTMPATTTTTLPVTGTTVVNEVDAEVIVPEGAGPFPAVVLVHGGGWVTGSPSSMRPLARHLNENGYLTVNTRYRLSSRSTPGFPEAIEDVACAARFAARHPDSDGSVTVIGHSAGAHIAAVVALNGDDHLWACPIRGGSGLPQRFVGLAGPYDVSRLGSVLSMFFGSSQTDDPESWLAGNPLELVDGNPDLEALIMYAENDGLIADLFAVEFHERLLEAGADSLLELVEGARHNEMDDPELVGDLIVTWLKR